MREKLEKELKKVRREMSRAEADGNSDLAFLRGWEDSLKWILKEIKKEKEGEPCDECGAIHDEEDEAMTIKEVGEPIYIGRGSDV